MRVIKVRVIPNSKRPEVKQDGEVLMVKVDAPAIKNKANERLIEILSKYFGVKKRNIKILKGHKSRDKLIEILQ